jgi:hypothetical protein
MMGTQETDRRAEHHKSPRCEFTFKIERMPDFGAVGFTSLHIAAFSELRAGIPLLALGSL